MNTTIRIFSIVLFFTFNQFGQAQDVEGLIKEAKGLKEKVKTTISDSLQITGGISAMAAYNYISGAPRRNGPFNYQLSGAVNFSKYGLSLPLSLNFAKERFVYNYNLPAIKLPSYSFAGMSPSYKWATLHIGDRAMTFSPYTLSGHGFRGAGIELNPGNFYFGAMYGRLQRAQAEDFNSLNNLDPTFKRMAWGFKTGYDTGSEHIYFILLKAKDDLNSLNEPNRTSEPADNTSISLQGKKQMTKSIALSIDYALSAFTQDQRMSEQIDPSVFKTILGLYQPRVNSEYLSAIKTSLEFKLKLGQLSFNHEWVQPGYRTLGALFFNNDFQNWTVGTKLNLFDKKLLLNTNVGIEKNNLSGLKENTANRIVASINAALILGEKWNINTAYSNFKNTTKLSVPTQPQVLLDSIILSQLNQNASLSISYITGEEKNANLTATFSYNQANTIADDQVQADQTTSNYIASLAHSYVFTASDLALTSAVLSNWSLTFDRTIFSFAPSLSVQKPFLDKKFNASSSFSYILVYTNKDFTNSIINWQVGLDYTLQKKHKLGLVLSLVNRKINDAINLENSSFVEFIGRLNYSWNF